MQAPRPPTAPRAAPPDEGTAAIMATPVAFEHDPPRHQDDEAAEDDASDDSDGRDEDDEDQDDEDGAAGRPETTPTGRWAFLDTYIETWFCHLTYAEAPASTRADPRFDTFFVHAASPANGADGDLAWREVLDATELVAYMLALDAQTWWYAKRRFRPWFRSYNPSRYDPLELTPTMTFTLSQVLERHPNDALDAAKPLHAMLLAAESTGPTRTAFEQAKRRVLEIEDRDRRLRDFAIPTRLCLQPPLPQHADELRSYLRHAVALVQAFQAKCAETESAFRFDSVTLDVYLAFLSDVHAELRALLTLGVPVTITLHHGVTGGFIPDAVEWFLHERANVFAVVAHDPGVRTDQPDDDCGVGHTLDCTAVASSYELWSAVAYAPHLQQLCVQPTGFNNPLYNAQIARWMGYALSHCTSLRRLEIAGFGMTTEELDALEAVLAAPVPSNLLPSAMARTSEVASHHITQLVRFKADAVVECQPGGEINCYEAIDEDEVATKRPDQLPLAELTIPSDWHFPVVQTVDATERVQCIVPGHGICAVPVSSVASFHETTSFPHAPQLTSLVLRTEGCEVGTTGRFVRLVGRALRELRWRGESMDAEDGIALDGDLVEIARVCPHLETLAVEETTLQSLVAPLTGLALRELRLVDTPVPMPALIAFFHALGDTTVLLATTLQRFTYYCPQQPLSIEAVDAAVAMLATNRRLYSVTLGLAHAHYDACAAQFDPVSTCHVVVERLPLASRVAFLSVVDAHHRTDPTHPLGQLDSGVLASVFQWLDRSVERRVQLFKGDE